MKGLLSVLLGFLLSLSSICVTATAQAPAINTATQPADRGWPRGYSLASEAQVVVYEPQVANWDDQKRLVALAAVSYVTKGEQKPALGTIKIEADTLVSTEQRLVKFSTLKITEANFQSLPKEQTREIIAEIEKGIPDDDRLIACEYWL